MEHDPLKDVDPWEHVQQRKAYNAQLEIYKEFGAVFGSALAGLASAGAKVEIVENHHEYLLESGQRLGNVHAKEQCGSKPCSLHGPSAHPLNKAPRSWQIGMIFRACGHGVDHPDYDSIAYLLDRDGAVAVAHKCCDAKCCGIPEWVEIGTFTENSGAGEIVVSDD